MSAVLKIRHISDELLSQELRKLLQDKDPSLFDSNPRGSQLSNSDELIVWCVPTLDLHGVCAQIDINENAVEVNSDQFLFENVFVLDLIGNWHYDHIDHLLFSVLNLTIIRETLHSRHVIEGKLISCT